MNVFGKTALDIIPVELIVILVRNEKLTLVGRSAVAVNEDKAIQADCKTLKAFR